MTRCVYAKYGLPRLIDLAMNQGYVRLRAEWLRRSYPRIDESAKIAGSECLAGQNSVKERPAHCCSPESNRLCRGDLEEQTSI